MINSYKRYQTGLTLADIYPSRDGECACGCGRQLGSARKKWHSANCRETAYVNFAIVKGDTSVIREQLYKIDEGACRNCGVITEDWEADHIVPVAEGGSACDISNFQTLCWDCHKEKTYKVPHHKAISSHAASIFFIRSLKPEGEHSIVC